MYCCGLLTFLLHEEEIIMRSADFSETKEEKRDKSEMTNNAGGEK
jgi:hypothetical protein